MSLELARRMKQVIDQDVEGSPSLHGLAAAVGLSRFQALRLFRRHYGVTPHQYLIRARVDRAIQMLLEGEPIAEIAAAVGFVDQSHLTRHFKKCCGTTPHRMLMEHARGKPAGPAIWPPIACT